jgi:hypothetical protein
VKKGFGKSIKFGKFRGEEERILSVYKALATHVPMPFQGF